MKHSLIFIALLGFLTVSCGPGEEATVEEQVEAPEELPFQTVDLSDLSAFRPAAANWSVAGRVIADHTKRRHVQTFEGTGVLVNQNSEDARDNLLTTWEHGDLELDIEVMVPQGSNSGIYFQGRYEIQVFDSWQKAEPNFSDCGGIYQRWDESRPEGKKGFEGHAPRINAAKAPGLWQHFYISFRAPRFDAAGNKIENARFEKVVHNGVVIHENVEVTGPTRASMAEDEVALAPLMFQGDHGPVAFRNILYKRYGDEVVKLENIQYQYYELSGPATELPDFDTLEMIKKGSTDSLMFEKLSERVERVAYIFTGQLQIPTTGDYLFHLFSDDGSQLFIDGEMLVDNDGKHDLERKSGLIELAAGTHELELHYFNNEWGRGLRLQYEGPEIRRQDLNSRGPERRQRERPTILVDAEEAPEMVRSFVMYQGEKLTHAMSVGDPKGIHYSVDLRRGALLKFWRGGFADVTEMWFQRGQPQLLVPQTMAVEANAGVVAAVLPNAEATYPTQHGEGMEFKGYEINDRQEPVFRYQIDQATVLDHYTPSTDGQELVRTIQAEKVAEGLYCRLAAADYIEDVGNGYFSIGGKYLLSLKTDGAEPLIRENKGQTEMIFPLTSSANEIKYSILW